MQANGDTVPCGSSSENVKMLSKLASLDAIHHMLEIEGIGKQLNSARANHRRSDVVSKAGSLIMSRLS